MASFDSVDYPMSMDKITQCLGAETIDWSYKTECCGASLFLSVESVSARLVAKILKDAVVRGADCIVVACPMCQTNLDTKQDQIREKFGISRPIPVIFITQLLGLAMGLDSARLGLNQNFVPFEIKHQAA
jgi:heterodisulfide reductase subunit B